MHTSSAPNQPFYNAFISYGRADSKDFATKLQAHLAIAGFKVWFDSNDIPLGVDFQNQINDGIEKADNFLFIIAPHSVNSPYCRKEIELAILRNKRIIPLLHVEHITREIWQQRNPEGTDAAWQAYQAQGLHSSFPNMHPVIGKINWVYFREGIDDFDSALAGLQAIFERHENYVRHHTFLLTQALEWERHQKQTRYLLTGEDRQTAELWLKQQFEDEQPPCEPTHLHCEFICESIKNANNLMTQVFLCHAEADSVLTEQIRSNLLREGITTWISKTDIQTGEAFEEAIRRGIEQADTLVCLISPDALRSRYWQDELDYAQRLNKRIIPILVQPTNLEQVPPQLRSLQLIDCSESASITEQHQAMAQLIKALREDAAYYEEHKILLTKALKWERQNHNPSILLRGYNLRHAEDWLKGAKLRSQYLPTPLQEAFIAESLRQPPAASVDVFISYSRADSDLARRLNEELQIRGKTTWFDQESIASGADFQQEIYQGIESADNFLFILSPRSVNSRYCADEVEHAAKLNKRFITVLHRAVNSAELHPELAKVQWIAFNQREGDFYPPFNQLVRTLETDREYVHSHTKWLRRALEWHAHDRSEDLLMGGSEFAIAEQWLHDAEHHRKQPPPTDLQKTFIHTSHDAIQAKIKTEKRRALLLRLLLALVSTAFVGAACIGIFAVQQKKAAELALDNLAKTLAQDSLSLTASESDQEFDALVQAIRAAQSLHKQRFTPKTQQQIIQALRDALDRITEHNRLEGHTKDIAAIHTSSDGQMVATASWDGTAKIWTSKGRLLHSLQHGNNVWGVSISPDSQLIVTYGRNKAAKLWNKQGAPLQILRHEDEIWWGDFSADGQTIATRSEDNIIKLWNRKGQHLKTLNNVEEARFSPKGQWLVTLAPNGTVQLWTSQGQKRQVIPQGGVQEVIFRPDGQAIATRTKQNIIVWGIDGKKLSMINHADDASSITFSPDGQKLAFTSKDNITIWKHKEKTLQLNQQQVKSVQFSPDSQALLTASKDNTVKLWRMNGEEIQTFQHSEPVEDAIFIPHTSLIMTRSGKQTVRIWDLINPNSQSLVGHAEVSHRAHFSSDGQKIITRSDDKTARLWTRSGKLISILRGHTQPLRAVSFSPDNTKVATVGKDSLLKLWTLDGKELFSKPLEHNVTTSLISFSPDGQRIAVSASDTGNESQVQIWSITGKLIRTLPKQWTPVFSPKQPIFATSSANIVYLWQQDGQELGQLKGHQDILLNVGFSSDGKLIATASGDKVAKLWNLQGQELAHLQHDEPVKDVEFSPNSQVVATAGENGTITLWNLQGQKLKSWRGHNERLFQVLFDPDGKTIATASNDYTIKLWNLEGELLRSLNHYREIFRMDFNLDGRQLVVATKQNAVTLWNIDLDNLQRKQLSELENLLDQACTWLDNYFQNKPQGDHERDFCESVRP